MRYVVGPKGQVVIAKDIRERLGIEPGWIALQRVVDDHVEIYFLPPPHRKSLRGSLAPYIKTTVGTGEEWSEAREAAWREAVRDFDANATGAQERSA